MVLEDVLIAAVEILLLAAAFYFLLRFLVGTRRASQIRVLAFFMAMVALFGLLALTEWLNLSRFYTILNWLLPVTVIALLIIFQPELRRAMIRIGQKPFMTAFLSRHSAVLEEVVQAVARLSKNHVGALIALERESSLDSYLEGGVRLEAQVSAELIETIFYPGTSLHDGAIVIQNDVISAAGCLFPLTDNPDIARSVGTRHRAGIGITEESDAICLIVSEETGRISVGLGGRLHLDLDRAQLERMLRDHFSKDEKEEAEQEEKTEVKA